MSPDDHAVLACSMCGRTREDVRKRGHSLICEKCMVCAFCGKASRNVGQLIAGPKVMICDECVALCVEIIEENTAGERAARVRKGLVPVCNFDHYARSLATRARRLAESCGKAVALPRPAAERARALAEEIEVFASAEAGSRAVFTEYANVVAASARSFARACDTLELPDHVAQRARALADEIEALVRVQDDS
jgi:hypothetical protein